MLSSGNAQGLSTEEAAARLEQYGQNQIPEPKPNALLTFLTRLWGPIPWMLEIAVILELLLGKLDEAIIITALILFNAVFSTIQEKRSSEALALLRQNLKVNARVLRDKKWQAIPAEKLVPGDLVYARMGDVLPADLELQDGGLTLDQSTLTGESLPVEVSQGDRGYAGAIVKHGEATALVTATGVHTNYGRTAELVHQAHSQSNLEAVVLTLTKALVITDGVLALAVIIFAILEQIPLLQILPFALILLVASVPVSLPASFTISTALGARKLSEQGVLVTNLAAIEEAAGMDVLCSDKTGTITQNKLSVVAMQVYSAVDETDLIRLAAMASDPSTLDPLDLAILKRAREHDVLPDFNLREQFLPFNPTTRRTEAFFQSTQGVVHVAKGAPSVIAPLCSLSVEQLKANVKALAGQGYRVLAVACGDGQGLQLAGIIALQDPPRPDSAPLVQKLQSLGIRIVLLTGDGLATARAIARQVGIGEQGCIARNVLAAGEMDDQCDFFAEVLPEQKYRLVQSIQRSGHIVGMTGDGVNDAPALSQAQVGIAVSTATDVAKASASLVLTEPGLENIIAPIKISRRIYQRMHTYILNKIIKTIQIAAFLSLGLIFSGVFVTTPLLVVLLIFANDFVSMSIATDRVHAPQKPARLSVGAMLAPALSLAIPLLGATFGIFLIGKNMLHLPIGQLQTLAFITLVFTGQGMVYLVRERQHFWASLPGKWMMVASALDILVIICLASAGILMQPIPFALIIATLALVAVTLFLLDYVKVWVFQRSYLH